MERLRLGSGTAAVGTRQAVAIGNFDGVHRGHQALVARAVARARETGGAAVVLTFDPHPARVLRPEVAPKRRSRRSRRRRSWCWRSASSGSSRCEFDTRLAALSARRRS